MKRPLSLNLALLIMLLLASGCAGPKVQAWNHYEAGMLLSFSGYDPSHDKVDKVEKHYLKALELNPFMPGVNASLATYKARKGDAAGATQYLEKEASTHPEAAKAMVLILDKVKERHEQRKKEKEAKKDDAKKEDAKPADDKKAEENKAASPAQQERAVIEKAVEDLKKDESKTETKPAETAPAEEKPAEVQPKEAGNA